MNRSYKKIPIYTADVSGVCSALYELGGMVVMHDPSGCNSTYNTHDENRWYTKDSLIFISGLSEKEAILGDDGKILGDVISTANELQPKFIAVATAPIPYMNGTDFKALTRIIEKQTGIPCFFVETNGMHDYVIGAGNALAEIADRFTLPAAEVIPKSLNLLGVTPLDYSAKNESLLLKNWAETAGWKVISCWAMDHALEQLQHAGEAELNLVVSAVGLQAAKVLKRKFGTPYIIGTPVGEFSDVLLRQMEEKVCGPAYDCTGSNSPDVTLIGEPVRMASIAEAIGLKYHLSTQLLCPLEGCEELLGPSDLLTFGEEGAEKALSGAKAVVADPLYRDICPPSAAFYPLPHLAFSGRCCRKDMKPILSLTI